MLDVPECSDVELEQLYDQRQLNRKNTQRILYRLFAVITGAPTKDPQGNEIALTNDPQINDMAKKIKAHFAQELLKSVGIETSDEYLWDEAPYLAAMKLSEATLAEVKRAFDLEGPVKDVQELKKDIDRKHAIELLSHAGWPQDVERLPQDVESPPPGVEIWDRAKKILTENVRDKLITSEKQAGSMIRGLASAVLPDKDGEICPVEKEPANIRECVENTQRFMGSCGTIAEKVAKTINEMSGDVQSVLQDIDKELDNGIKKIFESMENRDMIQTVVGDMVAQISSFRDDVGRIAQGVIETKPTLTIPYSVDVLSRERANEVSNCAEKLHDIVASAVKSLKPYRPYAGFALPERETFQAKPSSVDLSAIRGPLMGFLEIAEQSHARELTLTGDLQSKKEEARTYFDAKQTEERKCGELTKEREELRQALDNARNTQWTRLSMQRGVYDSQLKRLEAFYQSRLPQ